MQGIHSGGVLSDLAPPPLRCLSRSQGLVGPAPLIIQLVRMAGTPRTAPIASRLGPCVVVSGKAKPRMISRGCCVALPAVIRGASLSGLSCLSHGGRWSRCASLHLFQQALLASHPVGMDR